MQGEHVGVVVTEGPALSAYALTHDFGPVRALTDVSFDLAEGITGLVGVNGAGKSTLMLALAGALRPSRGQVRVGADDLFGRNRRRGLRKVALVPQLPVFPKNLTALEVVSYLSWMRGVSSKQAPARARESLAQVGLEARLTSKVGELSGGMLRRVAVAQALASEAEVLLLDEPTTGLDPHQRRTMVDLLQTLPGAVLISSHIMEDVADLAARVLVLEGGCLRFDGTREELATRAPAGTAEHRALEAGFLSLCLQAGAG